MIKVIVVYDQYLKLCSHPTYKRTTIFNENLVAVHRNKKYITLDKPIINGMMFLELSKYLMYDFYYNVLKKHMMIKQNCYLLIQIVYV